jgi:putative transcriptional regulator
MSDISINKGDVLISKPNILGDITFNKSIVLIVDFNVEGVVGFMINKPLDEDLNQLMPEVKREFKVFDGGPVERNKLYFIHSVPELISGGIQISDDLFWGGSTLEVTSKINSGLLNSNQIKFFLGYSGWGAYQLEDEINDDVWLQQTEMNSAEIIKCDSTFFWNENIRKLGGDYLIWSNAPDNPNYN